MSESRRKPHHRDGPRLPPWFVVRRARQQLLDVGANIFGVVLNNVKLESQQDYYYAGYYGYYSSHYYSADEDEKPEPAR